MDVERRMKEIETLNSFIQDKQNILKDVLQQLGWKEESLTDEIKVPCGSNSGHWIPQSAVSPHQQLCEWIEEGYVKEEFVKEPSDASFSHEKSSEVATIVIDAATEEKVLLECALLKKVDQTSTLNFPKTIDRWTVQRNAEQRLAIYDYVVKVANAAEKQPKTVTLEDLIIDFEKKDDQDEKPKSQLEILAEMRDYKRRRQSYRAKNVHITKKSYTEIMKEVIENQTSYLAESKKYENSQNRKIDSEIHDDLSPGDAEINSCSGDYSTSSRHKRKHSEYKEDKRHHHSKHESKKKKHKNRSRSRSPSRHKHKKSHRKRKRSYDSD